MSTAGQPEQRAQSTPITGAVPDGPHRMTIGLKPLRIEDWIEDQPDFVDQLLARQELVVSHDDVLASVDGAQAAICELLATLHTELPTHLPQYYERAGAHLRIKPLDALWTLDDSPSLEQIARIIPDDMCLMMPDAAGAYRMVAAALCFPTRWRLGPKMGKALTDIHGPVPGYAEKLAKGVDRVFAALRPEQPRWRVNWSLVDSPALYQPVRPSGTALARGCAGLPVETVLANLWLRSERQTIRRLPNTGCVVFGIRIRQLRLDKAIGDDPALAARIYEDISTMPDALATYKGVSGFKDVLGAVGARDRKFDADGLRDI